MNKLEKGNLIIDFSRIVDEMDADNKIQILKSLACTDDVITWVMDFITNNDEDGWWNGASPDIRQRFLEQVEDTQLGQSWLSVYWKPWGDLRDKLKEIAACRETYDRLHKLMYDYDNPMSEKLRRIFNGEECSHYTTKLADEKIRQIETLVTDTLRAMRKPNPEQEIDEL